MFRETLGSDVLPRPPPIDRFDAPARDAEPSCEAIVEAGRNTRAAPARMAAGHASHRATIQQDHTADPSDIVLGQLGRQAVYGALTGAQATLAPAISGGMALRIENLSLALIRPPHTGPSCCGWLRIFHSGYWWMPKGCAVRKPWPQESQTKTGGAGKASAGIGARDVLEAVSGVGVGREALQMRA